MPADNAWEILRSFPWFFPLSDAFLLQIKPLNILPSSALILLSLHCYKKLLPAEIDWVLYSVSWKWSMNKVGIKVGWKIGSNLTFVFGCSIAEIMSDKGVRQWQAPLVWKWSEFCPLALLSQDSPASRLRSSSWCLLLTIVSKPWDLPWSLEWNPPAAATSSLEVTDPGESTGSGLGQQGTGRVFHHTKGMVLDPHLLKELSWLCSPHCAFWSYVAFWSGQQSKMTFLSKLRKRLQSPDGLTSI